jgi:hypothetical protein
MMKPGVRFVTLAWCVLLSACGSSTTHPTPVTYAGEWAGTTVQGSPITFTVSADEKVTSITIAYNFNGCTGSTTLSNLNIAIGVPGAVTAALADYAAGPPGGPNSTAIHFFFPSTTAANGSVAFINYSGCGNSGGTWSAVKR